MPEQKLGSGRFYATVATLVLGEKIRFKFFGFGVRVQEVGALKQKYFFGFFLN
jgi:hypothetical protein